MIDKKPGFSVVFAADVSVFEDPVVVGGSGDVFVYT